MPISRRTGVSHEPSGDRVVILDVKGTVMTTLNPVGAKIWGALDGVRDLPTIAADLEPEFVGVDADTLLTDIVKFVETLRESDLVEGSD